MPIKNTSKPSDTQNGEFEVIDLELENSALPPGTYAGQVADACAIEKDDHVLLIVNFDVHDSNGQLFVPEPIFAVIAAIKDAPAPIQRRLRQGQLSFAGLYTATKPLLVGIRDPFEIADKLADDAPKLRLQLSRQGSGPSALNRVVKVLPPDPIMAVGLSDIDDAVEV